jgi:hypothetical protein
MLLNWELTALESRCRTFPSVLGLQKTTSFQEKWELKIPPAVMVLSLWRSMTGGLGMRRMAVVTSGGDAPGMNAAKLPLRVQHTFGAVSVSAVFIAEKMRLLSRIYYDRHGLFRLARFTFRLLEASNGRFDIAASLRTMNFLSTPLPTTLTSMTAHVGFLHSYLLAFFQRFTSSPPHSGHFKLDHQRVLARGFKRNKADVEKAHLRKTGFCRCLSFHRFNMLTISLKRRWNWHSPHFV